MTIYCLYSRFDGTTTITPVLLRDPGTDPFRASLPTGAGATILSGHKDRQGDWHTTPKTGVTVVLAGHLTIETRAPAPIAVQLSAGDVLLVLDRSGAGHRSRAHGPSGMTALLLPLSEAEVSNLAGLFADWPGDIHLP